MVVFVVAAAAVVVVVVVAGVARRGIVVLATDRAANVSCRTVVGPHLLRTTPTSWPDQLVGLVVLAS